MLQARVESRAMLREGAVPANRAATLEALFTVASRYVHVQINPYAYSVTDKKVQGQSAIYRSSSHRGGPGRGSSNWNLRMMR